MATLKFNIPKPDMARYEAMLEAGFRAYPKRLENYQKYKENPRSIEVDYMPIRADIENVSRCNLRCGHCLISSLEGQRRAKDLSFDDFKRFIDEQYGLVEIKLQGVGEPFLQREFCDMARYASDRYIWVRTTTNGMLLHKNENYKRIIDANVGEIQVSIDGATKATQEGIRVGSNFERIVENCKLLNDYSRQTGIDMTRMWTVLQKQNFHEASALLDIASDTGFRRLTLSLELRDWNGMDDIKVNNTKSRLDSMQIDQGWIDRLLEKARGLGVELTFFYAVKRFCEENICFWPFERFLLSSDGYIVPCCIIADPAILNFGEHGDFNSIWNGSAMVKFREAHLKGEIPKICRACYQ